MSDYANDVPDVKHRRMPPKSPWGDFLTFKTMITPVLIQILFWLGMIACIISGVVLIKYAYHGSDRWGNPAGWDSFQVGVGIAWILLGPLVVRIYCEFAILFFRMNGTLTEILNALKGHRGV